jgi:hypothetical protein
MSPDPVVVESVVLKKATQVRFVLQQNPASLFIG